MTAFCISDFSYFLFAPLSLSLSPFLGGAETGIFYIALGCPETSLLSWNSQSSTWNVELKAHAITPGLLFLHGLYSLYWTFPSENMPLNLSSFSSFVFEGSYLTV